MRGTAAKEKVPRRVLASLGIWSSVNIHLRSPYIVAFWSMTFAGFGHILVDKYFRGFVLVAAEVFLNVAAHINQSIFYTLSGQFDLAKQVLDLKWMLLYVAIYGFSIWDSYREAVDINNSYVLAAREDAEISSFKMSPSGLSYLTRNVPWLVTVWSSVLPGSGEFVTQKMNRSFFVLAFWIATVYFSRALPAIHYTFMGQYSDAKSIIDWQWFLNIPSIYFFALYDSYVSTVEENKLYEWELSKYMKKEYQDIHFEMPAVLKERGSMYIVSEFKYTNKLEQAVTAMQMIGIKKEQILAVPLDKKGEKKRLLDSTHSSDGLSLLDLPFVLAMVLTLLGSIFGFKLYLGPIWWGVFGALTGFIAGLAIKLLVNKKKMNKRDSEQACDIFVIVACTTEQMNAVRDTLWQNSALGVGALSLGIDS